MIENIEQTRNKALMTSNEALMKSNGEACTNSHETIKETQDKAPVYVDTKTAKLLHDMGAQTNPQLKLNLVDLPTRRYKRNDVNITLEQGAFLVKDNIFELTEGFTNFLTKSNVLYDDIEEDENNLKSFFT